MRNRFFLCVLGCLSLLAAGCERQPTRGVESSSNSAEAGSSTSVNVHDHPSEGPHHGTLVELGNEEYHLEVTHDANSVTLYVLDRNAKNAVAIDSRDITINTLHDGKPEQFKLLANPLPTDPTGKSSRFALANGELAALLDEESATPKLSLTIDGTHYGAEIKHVHAHASHDHAH